MTKNVINEAIEKMNENAKKDLDNILKIKKINISKNNKQDMTDENENNEIIIHRRIVAIKKPIKWVIYIFDWFDL